MSKLCSFLTIILLLFACSKEAEVITPPAPNKYTLTITAEAGGTVSSPGGTYNEGSKITITATPDGQYLFEKWSDGSTVNPREITVTANLTLSATFVKKTYPLAVTIEGEGTVQEEVIIQGSTSETTYNAGTTVRLTATPNEGWVFAGWSGDVESEEKVIEVAIEKGTAVSATFRLSTLSEKYSSINSLTSFYQSQYDFTAYLTPDYLKQIRLQDQSAHIKLYWPGLGQSIVGDVDGDDKADVIALGFSMCDDHVYGYHPGKLIVIYDYESNNDRTIVDSSIHAGSLLLSDFDNDGIADVYLYSHSMKMNHYDAIENIGGGTNISPKQSEIFTFKNRNIEKFEIGYFGDSASAAAGDVDNDGDIDIVQWPIPTVYNNQAYDYEPKILINQGGFNFSVNDILTDYSHLGSSLPPNENSFYATAIGVFDINDDGYLDLLVGNTIGPTKAYELYPRFDTSLTAPMIFWGNGTGGYSMGSSLRLSESFYMSRNWLGSTLGFGFTDYDNDGDIDILATTTRAEMDGTHFNGLYYDQYALILWENNNSVYNEVSEVKIENNFNTFKEFPNFYSIRIIDIDQDGDFDIVPDHIANFGDYPVSDSRHWKNQEGRFIFNH